MGVLQHHITGMTLGPNCSSNFIPNRIQQCNTVCMTNIPNSRVIIYIVMWFCWWPPEKPWAHQAGSQAAWDIEIWTTQIHSSWQAAMGPICVEPICYWSVSITLNNTLNIFQVRTAQNSTRMIHRIRRFLRILQYMPFDYIGIDHLWHFQLTKQHSITCECFHGGIIFIHCTVETVLVSLYIHFVNITITQYLLWVFLLPVTVVLLSLNQWDN